jgi:outer membrane protein assembly factor BamB
MKITLGSRRAAVIVTFYCLAVAGATGGDWASWPQFRGNGGAAIAANDRATAVDLDPSRSQLWATELPVGHSSPCVWQDRIIVTGFNAGDRTLEVISLEMGTGRIVWRRTLEPSELENHHEISNPATSTAATDGKTVVVYFGSRGLLAYDFEGKELWRRALPMAKTPMGFGTGTSPVIAGGKVILDVQLGEESYLGAWDVSTGEEVWKAPRPLYNRGWSTPITWSEAGGSRAGMAAAGRFIAYDLTDGREVWWVEGLAQQVCATPSIEAGVAFVTSAGVLGERDNITVPIPFAEAVAAYDSDGDGLIAFAEIPESLLFADRHTSNGAGNMTVRQMLMFGGEKEIPSMNEEAWEKMRTQVADFKQSAMNQTSLMAVRLGEVDGAPAARVVWQESRGVPEVPSPLVYRGRVWLVRNGGLLTCRDATSGKSLFDERIGAPGGYYASPVAAGGKIYLASDRGVLTVVQAEDKLQVLARNDLSEPIYATPAVVDGKLLVRTLNRLLAFAPDRAGDGGQQSASIHR